MLKYCHIFRLLRPKANTYSNKNKENWIKIKAKTTYTTNYQSIAKSSQLLPKTSQQIQGFRIIFRLHQMPA